MTAPAPLYVRVMGDASNEIAEPLRSLHATHSIRRAHGQLCIERGHRSIARLLAWMLRLPRANTTAAIELTITPRAASEYWERTFDGRRLDTVQYESRESGLAEHFGLVEFRFDLRATGGSLVYVQREAFLRWPVRLRIPARWAPRVDAREDPAGPTRFRVEVHVVVPAIGELISYVGTIEVVEAPL